MIAYSLAYPFVASILTVVFTEESMLKGARNGFVLRGLEPPETVAQGTTCRDQQYPMTTGNALGARNTIALKAQQRARVPKAICRALSIRSRARHVAKIRTFR